MFNWTKWGPLLFATMLLAISVAVKLIAFEDYLVFLDIAPDLTLWATGVLFSLSVSERALLGARLITSARRDPNGNSVNLKYDVYLPDTPDFTPRFLYLFVFLMMLWIFSVLFTGVLKANPPSAVLSSMSILFVLNSAIAGSAVGLALKCTNEVEA